MEAYKSILNRELQQHGWDVQSVDPDGAGWWADEHWTISSTREHWGMTLVISFLVDPQWDTERKKGQGVWALSVTAHMPDDRLDAENSIAQLLCVNGPYTDDTKGFVASINSYRHSTADSA